MIIGVCGLMDSGKSTIGKFLVANGSIPLAFGGAVKDAVANIFAWDRLMLEGDTPESRDWREQKDEFWSEKLGYDITPRYSLQLMGTEAGRKVFGDNLWINSVRAQMKDPNRSYVITDCRFPNEADAIREWGGSVIMVRRGEIPYWYTDATNNEMDKHPDIHASEYSVAQCHYDYLIKNDGTKQELNQKIRRTVSKILLTNYNKCGSME